MNIYLPDGWLDVAEISNQPQFIKTIIGGRGIGKTYGVLSYAYDKICPSPDCIVENEKFILLRTTKTEAEFLYQKDFNPFKTLNTDRGINVSCERLNEYMGIFFIEKEDGEKAVIGYVLALSTVAKIRGFDASDCQRIIYDEFIPESHIQKLKNSGMALLNAYETVNRNRELKGKKPVELWLLSNSNDLDNDIMLELDILSLHDKIKNHYAANDNILLIEPADSPISYRKAATGIYALSRNFNKMSLNNEFVGHYEGNVRSMNLKNGAVWIQYDNLYFYSFKDSNLVYCTMYKKPKEQPLYKYGDTTFENKKFKTECHSLFNFYLTGNMFFENSKCEALFNKIWE
ncbi:MAG: phage DNA encapsidation protein [Methanobrevibacter sp.]|nr:phage DNA encapsidation protein [Methanobrevibacter sp.]